MYTIMYIHLCVSFIRYHVADDSLGLNINYASNAPSPYLTPRSRNLKEGLY